MTSSSWSIVRHARARSDRSSCGGGPLAVATRGHRLSTQLAQVLHLGERRPSAVGHGNGGRLGRHQRQVERRGPADLGRELDHARVAGEPARLLGTAAQVRAGRGRQPRVELVEAAPGPHRGDRRGERALRGRGVVDVVGGDARPRRGGRPARRARRCGPSRAGRRGPTARPAPGRARTARSAGAARGAAAAGPSATSAGGTAPLRHPVSTHPWPRTGVGEVGADANCGAPFSPARCPRLSARARRA